MMVNAAFAICFGRGSKWYANAAFTTFATSLLYLFTKFA